MATYKNIRIKKKGGGTRIQRVQVMASGKYKFVKNTGTTSKRKASSRTKTKKRRTTMARRKKRRSGSRKLSLPIALMAGVGVGMVGPAQEIISGNWDSGLRHLAENYSGVYVHKGGSISFTDKWKNGIVPLILGALIHKYVGGAPLNVNRALASSGVPIIRI